MNTDQSSTPFARGALKVGIAGLGTIGKAVAERLIRGMPGLSLTAIATRNTAAAEQFLRERHAEAILTDLPGLAPLCDVIIEALPAAAFDAVAEPALKAGRTFIVISVGTLLARPGLEELAARHGGRIVVPTGALLGLDAVQAAAQGEIHSVRMVTRKPPRGLMGAPYLVANNINLEGLVAPLKVYEGSAREAVIGFPANVNVAAALSLAGIGPDRTTIEIWADPALERNHHAIFVESDSASFSMEISNIPSENPKTGRITALSVIAALRKLQAPISIGT